VADASRIRASIPTIVFLAAAGARVVLLSHLGRPKGPDINFSLMPVATVVRSLSLCYKMQMGPGRWSDGRWTERTPRARMQLSKLLADEGVQFMGHLGDCLGQEVQAAVARLENGQVDKALALTNRTASHLYWKLLFPNGRGRKPSPPFT
jgi:3-phosphoglycerate kinase